MRVHYVKKVVSNEDLGTGERGQRIAMDVEGMVAYMDEVEQYKEFSNAHWNIAPPVLDIPFSFSFEYHEMDQLLDTIERLYAGGGSIGNVDLSHVKSNELVVRALSHIAKQAHLFTRGCQHISLACKLRSQSTISALFGSDHPIGLITKSLDLSGCKLRDQLLADILLKLLRGNKVESLNLDDNVIGENACTSLRTWLSHKECSLRRLSVRNCGLFARGFGRSSVSDGRNLSDHLNAALGHPASRVSEVKFGR